MRRACIDIGSNTTRLLVADCEPGGLVRCHEERVFTQIGASLDPAGRIPPDKLDEVAAAVRGQLASARRLGAGAVECVATAGVRMAANGAELVDRVASVCGGLEVRVLGGEEEARCAFTGAVWGFRPRVPTAVDTAPIAVVDVGGGSTELAVGTAPDRVSWWVSLPTGSAALTRAAPISETPQVTELDRARALLRAEFAGLAPPAVEVVLAVGGSASSLRAFAGGVLDDRALDRALYALTDHPVAEIAARTGLDIARVRLMPAGIVILETVSRLFARPLVIATAGLREGLLLAAERR